MDGDLKLQIFAAALADRMILRLLMVAVAKASRPDNPEAFVRNLEAAAIDQLDTGSIAPFLRHPEDEVKEAIVSNIKDVTGRLTWTQM